MVIAPLKMLFVLDEFAGPTAGTEAQFWLLVRGLDQRVLRPAVVVLRRSDYLEKHLTGIELVTLGIVRLFSVRSVWRALRFAFKARAAGFKLAQLYLSDATVFLPLPLWLAGIKVVTSKRDLGFWQSASQRRILRFNRYFVSAVIANCEAAKSAVVAQEGYRPVDVRVVANGYVSADTFPHREEARNTLGFVATELLMVHVANLKPLKRAADAIRALAVLTVEFPLLRLIVVGGDILGANGESHRGVLEALAQDLRVSSHVTFTGGLPSTTKYVAAADICLLCSESEGLSNALIEYQAAGRATVCSDAGGNSEVVADGETGFIYAAGDVEKLTERIRQLLLNRALRNTMAKAARARARKLFSLEKMIDQHTRIYSDVAG